MAVSLVDRLRGVAFLVSGLAAAALVGYLLLYPHSLVTFHPLPLVALLALTVVVAIWQANRLLRGDPTGDARREVR
ncbi:MAG: hypothetical protein ABEJ06_04930 [Haloarculaceae archaeon]